MTAFALVGAGGFAREVMDWGAPFVRTTLGSSVDICFVQETPSPEERINGENFCSLDGFLSRNDRKYFAIAIANANVRRRLAEKIEQQAEPLTLIAPSAMVGQHNSIAPGAIICPFACITSNAKIGRHFHCNIYSYVAHDCVIGDFVTFAPRVACNGNVNIADEAYLGTGASIRQGIPGKPTQIGRGAVVGMQANVLKTVPELQTVIGNPAVSLDR
jgi:sugar O-acyltransferase (sialic acid O-acetyltransferase NeuD family)